MQFPSSLVARVLKARYFKHTGFMNAGLGSKLSFVWRSIVWGRQVVHKGARWRIGNGQNVLVYGNNWIPRPTTFKPISAPSMGTDTTVAELIDEKQQWREDLILQHFRPEDAEAIMQIPLPKRPKEDQLIWHYDKRGQYSVKSGYQVASQNKLPKSFKEGVIWSLSIPAKIKVFMWRESSIIFLSMQTFQGIIASDF